MKKHKSKVGKKSKVKKSHKKYLWLEGAAIAAAFAVGAVMLAKSKTGKKLWKQTKKDSQAFLKYLAPQVKKVKKMGEAEYKQLVSKAMQSYKKNKKLPAAEVRSLITEAKAAWKKLAK